MVLRRAFLRPTITFRKAGHAVEALLELCGQQGWAGPAGMHTGRLTYENLTLRRHNRCLAKEGFVWRIGLQRRQLHLWYHCSVQLGLSWCQTANPTATAGTVRCLPHLQ
jgi:hypothetical protein